MTKRWAGGITALVFTALAAAHARPAALADTYHLKLTSAWPQLAGAGDRCRNGGDEVIEGNLRRDTDGVYRGSLDRHTELLFCGAHGPRGEACELVLEGDGTVAMEGFAVPDRSSPSGHALKVSWRPTAAHGAATRGACPPEFKRDVEHMYLSVRHGAEFPLPAAGGDEVAERLEDYAWTVEVR